MPGVSLEQHSFIMFRRTYPEEAKERASCMWLKPFQLCHLMVLGVQYISCLPWWLTEIDRIGWSSLQTDSRGRPVLSEQEARARSQLQCISNDGVLGPLDSSNDPSIRVHIHIHIPIPIGVLARVSLAVESSHRPLP